MNPAGAKRGLIFLAVVAVALGLTAVIQNLGRSVDRSSVQTEAQAKYEADLNKQYEQAQSLHEQAQSLHEQVQSLRPFVYSSEPPQDWLDGCIDFQRLINQKYANARAKYNLRDGYLPPESSCRETWKDPAGQRQWHEYSLEQKQKSIWLDPVARQQKVRDMPELN
jgi:hypothetical protein